MEESKRPDKHALAKELDGMEGGRPVDAAAVKAWMKNRYHTCKRTRRPAPSVPGERKQRQDFNAAQLKRLVEVRGRGTVEGKEKEGREREEEEEEEGGKEEEWGVGRL
eukprot:768784-Hanusia_phi.AAC.3